MANAAQFETAAQETFRSNNYQKPMGQGPELSMEPGDVSKMDPTTIDTALHAIALLAKALTTVVFIRMALYIVDWFEYRKSTKQIEDAVMRRFIITMENSQNDGKLGQLIKLEPKDKKT